MKYSAIFLVILALISASCTVRQDQSLATPWVYEDLDGYDPVDSPTPTTDILAGYQRIAENDIQFRFDFLDMNLIPDFDLYLALDAIPGGANDLPFLAKTEMEWDLLFFIPAQGEIQSITPEEIKALQKTDIDVSVRVFRNPDIDMMTVSLSNKTLASSGLHVKNGSPLRYQVFITQPRSGKIIDQTKIFSTLDQPPQVPVLMAVWNTFPAYTPAQALRRWDGAHTGPQGGRHGLYNLLRTARSNQVPLFLLDLNMPTNLSILDYMGGLELIHSMQQENLIFLPQVLPGLQCNSSDSTGLSLPGSAVERALAENRKVAEAFDVLPFNVLYSPTGINPLQTTEVMKTGSKIKIVFMHSNQTEGQITGSAKHFIANVFHWEGKKLILLPVLESDEKTISQATTDGVSIEVNQALIETALSSTDNKTTKALPLVILGGNLPSSDWGIPQNARAAFRYLHSRPWIKFFNQQDILKWKIQVNYDLSADSSFSNEIASQIPAPLPGLIDELLNLLQADPDHPILKAAWQTYLSFYQPVFPASSQLAELRTHYLHQVGSLLEAYHWSINPIAQAGCQNDPDKDGQPECILSSEDLFLLFELNNGGYLAYAFFRTGDKELHQLIGPSSQIIVGVSSSDQWDFSQGLLADSSVIPGVMVNADRTTPALKLDQVHISDQQITFNRSISAQDDLIAQVTYRLIPNGFQIQIPYQLAQTAQVATIPLLIDPWIRFEPDWALNANLENTESTISWEVKAGFKVIIQAAIFFEASSFHDSVEFLTQSENPNQEYPIGHYLPNPMAVIKVNSGPGSLIQVTVTE